MGGGLFDCCYPNTPDSARGDARVRRLSPRCQRAARSPRRPPPPPPIDPTVLNALPCQTRRWLETHPEEAVVRSKLLEFDPWNVFLKVYDITEGRAQKVVKIAAGFDVEGVWHTSVLCHGREKFYCDGPMSLDPSVVEQKFAIELRHIYWLGRTTLSGRRISKIAKALGQIYTPENYDIIKLNCNHYTESLLRGMQREGCTGLIAYAVPVYIAEQPQLFLATARGRALVWLVQNVLERTDNFLTHKFARGLDALVQKFRQ